MNSRKFVPFLLTSCLPKSDDDVLSGKNPLNPMGQRRNIGSTPHYHIRWSNATLDWEALATKECAKVLGERLKRPGESFTVEEFDGECERCHQFRRSAVG